MRRRVGNGQKKLSWGYVIETNEWAMYSQELRGDGENWSVMIYIGLQLCKMTDARASHINAEQGTLKAQNTLKLGQLNKAIKCPSDDAVGRLVQRMS
jgi:hypothetical protein